MGNIRAAISGVHGYVPEGVLTNKDLEKLVETNDEWIRTRTGIEERRILKKEGWATSDMGVEALKGLLKKTGTKPEEIEVLICATVTPDHIFPATSNIICHKIGAVNAFGFDLNAACSGFLFALTTATQFIESGAYKKVVVVGADMMSAITDYTDRSTCILFGDGAGAVLLEPSKDENGIVDSYLKVDGSGREFLHMKAGGSLKPPSYETIDNKEHFVFQEGRPVFKAAVNGMVSSIESILERNNLPKDDVDWLVPHQANKRIIDVVGNFLNLPSDRVMLNIDKYGNTTAATIPLCLWDYEDQLEKGQNVLLTAFGGGYTWGATYIKWAF